MQLARAVGAENARMGGRRSAAAVALLLALTLPGAPALASGEMWKSHPQHLSLVVAASDDREETAATLGLDYEYRANALLGVGFVAEYAFEEIDATTLLAVVDIHLWRGLVIQTGPGVEFVHGGGEEDAEQEFAFRVGALYEIEQGHFPFSPQLHYDYTTGADSIVFGGAFGFGF